MKILDDITNREVLMDMEDDDLYNLAASLLNNLESKEPRLSLPHLDPHIVSLANSEYKCNTGIESLIFLSRDVYKECTYRLLSNKL